MKLQVYNYVSNPKNESVSLPLLYKLLKVCVAHRAQNDSGYTTSRASLITPPVPPSLVLGPKLYQSGVLPQFFFLERFTTTLGVEVNISCIS